MTNIAGKASKEDTAILHAAIGLAPQIRAASEEIERGRQIPPPLAAAMKEAGIFGMVMPRAWGGPELDPMMQFRIIEALATEDGSVGWCAMIGCDAGYISAFLDQDIARAMFPDLLSAIGAAATPTGTATVVPGAIASAGVSHSSAGVTTANGYGSAATLSRTARRASMRTAFPKRGNAWCGSSNARFSTPGIRPGCAVPAATTSLCATGSSRPSTASAFRIRNW
jgi:Acyl-CoA dehydrogenase, N-terminal domain